MINLTRFNGSSYYLNAELIQSVEATPDTVITLTNNVKVVVKEPINTVIKSIMDYQKLIHNPGTKIYSGPK
jgi:flagellar protein FlbD